MEHGAAVHPGIALDQKPVFEEPRRQADPKAARKSDPAGDRAGIPVQLVGLSAEKLPIADASFETVVSTYTLCTIADPVGALKEMRRVLAPGGKLLFSEHGRAPDAAVLRWQTRLQPYWGKIAGGCMLDRDIPALLERAGFKPEVQSRYIPGPKILSFHYWGEAIAA
jgi:SAM-dependent methyltransferase